MQDTLIPGQLIKVIHKGKVVVMQIACIDLLNDMLWAERLEIDQTIPRKLAVSWPMVYACHDYLNSDETSPEWVIFRPGGADVDPEPEQTIIKE